MQRGLVGSEMCIRDRYQRRVHGDLANMIQTNLNTKMKRRLFRGVPPAPKLEKVRWEFLSSEPGQPNNFISYQSAENALIEAAYATGNSTVNYSHGLYTYTINFRKLIQINDSTKKERSIRRIIEAPAISPKSLSSSSGLSLCKICSNKPCSIVLNPCGHLGYCEECAAQLPYQCPVCGVPIISKIKIFTA
eukprot:TRINITY_DN26262_c0_g1_i1.p1 TRINITY_DN26262_c0_g1~~TRINITY_DN26262_c0_g1_i1.p1  ORF type:complete len:191 (-),score=30.61 TRINITY_DN26262_c0_g1_i1:182-754(-)